MKNVQDENQLKVTLHTEQETQLLGEFIAKSFDEPFTCYLSGDLGVGKTRLVRAIIQSLGFSGTVKSPTYTIVEPYKIGQYTIHHFDLYRLADPEELDFLGIRDYFDGASYNFFEWPEKGKGWIEAADLSIDLSFDGPNRLCVIQANSKIAKNLLKKLKQYL